MVTVTAFISTVNKKTKVDTKLDKVVTMIATWNQENIRDLGH